MPLTFQTINHGRIAFGFFNIESDMLLLQHCFFFAEAFCHYISTCAAYDIWDPLERFSVYEITDPEDVGDLMGAINGIRYTGFIGDTYRKFPFPDNPLHFKQNPLGYKSQDTFREMITPYAQMIEIPFLRLQNQNVRIGDYIFDLNNFHELLRYVERGGFPGWLNNLIPEYVDFMKKAINGSTNNIFSGLKFDT